uniref:Uncharacterized protein n=1 Tax=Meloidogyne enterolobii TaxID=390850 RepID=A0A6V7WA80_MELEN|nr:unnamed protein product [Meloidogyne enterolobii]
MHSFETEKYCHPHLPQMRFHYSMPAIVNSLQDSVPDKVKFRRSDTEDFLIERKAGASSELSNHQSPLKQDDFCNTQTNQNVTPSTLSDCETEDKLPAFNQIYLIIGNTCHYHSPQNVANYQKHHPQRIHLNILILPLPHVNVYWTFLNKLINY